MYTVRNRLTAQPPTKRSARSGKAVALDAAAKPRGKRGHNTASESGAKPSVIAPAKAPFMLAEAKTPPSFPADLIIAAPAGRAIATVPWPANLPAASKPAPRTAETRGVTRKAKPRKAAAPKAILLPPPVDATSAGNSAPPRANSPAQSGQATAAPAPLPRKRSLTTRPGGGLFGLMAEVLRFAGLMPAIKQRTKKPAAHNAEMARLRAENAALRRQVAALLAAAQTSGGAPIAAP